MTAKLIKKGTKKPVAKSTKKKVSDQNSLQKAVQQKVASRGTNGTDARSAWKKLFG